MDVCKAQFLKKNQFKILDDNLRAASAIANNIDSEFVNLKKLSKIERHHRKVLIVYL